MIIDSASGEKGNGPGLQRERGRAKKRKFWDRSSCSISRDGWVGGFFVLCRLPFLPLERAAASVRVTVVGEEGEDDGELQRVVWGASRSRGD